MADRIITRLPFATLWDDEGRDTPSQRGLDVGSDEIRELLRREPGLTFVVANVGAPLRRVEGTSRFVVWKQELGPHLAEPTERIDLDAYPDGLAYTASIWRERDRPVVVFQAHH